MTGDGELPRVPGVRAGRGLRVSVSAALGVGVTTCVAAPLGVVVQAFVQLSLITIDPVPWPRALDALPSVASILAVAVVVGIAFGLLVLAAPVRRMAVARRSRLLVLLAGGAFFGWALNASVLVLPFMGAVTLTGLGDLTQAVVLGLGCVVTMALSSTGFLVLLCSERLAEDVNERAFGLGSRSCRRCGYAVVVTRCPECGELACRMKAALEAGRRRESGEPGPP